MCGILQKKIKIKEKNIERTMKSQNIWHFIAKTKGKTLKTPLQYIVIQWSLTELREQKKKKRNKEWNNKVWEKLLMSWNTLVIIQFIYGSSGVLLMGILL